MSDAQQQRIAALEAELAGLRAEMQDYTYTVSHDLRAPLRHILSYAQLAQEEAGPLLPEESRGFLQTISESAQHMGSLLDGLTDLSRLGTSPVHCAPVPLDALLRDVMTDVMQPYPGRAVQWAVPPHAPEVMADTNLLRRALHCILDNALKFTAQRSVAHIAIAVEVQDGADNHRNALVTLSIQDNGAGFNPAMQDRLFKPFQRLHTTRQFPGIGMGLALTHKIAQRMNGAVTIEGTPDAGCRVQLSLPAA
jgi:light-regulated signal transduction histidine kinase (bacteriophytochrome)